MTPERLCLDGFSIQPTPGWEDIRDSAAKRTDPITIASAEDGVGALQISVARYLAGPNPNATIETLREMLDEFALAHTLGDGFDSVAASGTVTVAGKSYRSEDEFIRVWYVSDGCNFALITYVCDWGVRNQERSTVEAMIASFEFD